MVLCEGMKGICNILDIFSKKSMKYNAVLWEHLAQECVNIASVPLFCATILLPDTFLATILPYSSSSHIFVSSELWSLVCIL